MSDVEIIKKLRALGLDVIKQKLSPIWRNPFYCGIIRNKLLGDDLAKGNWESMVSQKEFLIVQNILLRSNRV